MMKKILATIASMMPNSIKIGMYRLAGYKIGKGVKIGFMTLILAKKVDIRDNVHIGSLNIFKMKNLEVGKNSTIRSLNMMMGPKSLKIGERVQIVGPFTFMNLAEDITLDDRCGIGSHSIFYTHGVYLPYTEGHPRKFGKIHLGKRVWSPSHIVFLPGVTIGDDSIISVGSIVNRSFPEDSLISGNPAKKISKASNLKVKMTKEKFNKRLNDIISDFAQNEYLKNYKVATKDNELIIEKENKKYLIKIQSDNKSINIGSCKEAIIIGENLPEIKNKRISIFDFKKRKMTLNGKLSTIFLDHLETYGEYFD